MSNGDPLLTQQPVQQQIEENSADTGQLFKYPPGVGGTGTEYPHYIKFTAKRSYTSSTQGRRGTENGEVVLYMPPDALKTAYTQSIGDVELGGFIALANQDLAGAGDALAAGDITGAMRAAGVIKGNVAGADKLSVAKDFGKVAVTEFGKRASAFAGAGAQAVSRATGQILNPHKAVVYQGPGGFRTFSYTFILIPRSAEEAKEIYNIVRFFKIRMHPGTGAQQQINSSVTLTYPDEFSIRYYVNNKEATGEDPSKPLFKIHNCFLESFNVDYATSGLTSFTDDNQPLTTTISLSLKETQLLTKRDIRAGY